MAPSAPRGPSSPLPVLTFHTIEDDPSPLAFPPKLFRDLVSAICAEGYQTLTLSELAESLAPGRPLPPRSLVLSFDDGFRSVYRFAFPLLREAGLAATIFLSPGDTAGPMREGRPRDPAAERFPSIDGFAMLNWAEVRAMNVRGIEFGAHTRFHPDLTTLSAERLEGELAGVSADMAAQLGSAVTCFAYPFGRWNATVRHAVTRSYACACTDQLGLVVPESDPFTLPRIDTYYLRSALGLRLLFSPWLRTYIQACNLPRRLRRRVARARPSVGKRCASA